MTGTEIFVTAGQRPAGEGRRTKFFSISLRGEVVVDGPISVPSLDQIARDPDCVNRLPLDARVSLSIRAANVANITATSVASALLSARTTADEGPRFALSLDEGAAMLGVTPRWLREHRELPFVRRLSRKNIVVDEAGLRRWRDARRAA